MPFELVSELEESSEVIGQDRAVDAVEFAVQIRHKGYNIYALGPSGTGKHTIVEDLLRRRAESAPTPPDWCYVNNFTDPPKPRRVQLPSGRASGLREAMRRLVEELRAALPAAFERDDYHARREVVDEQLKGEMKGPSASCSGVPNKKASPCCVRQRAWHRRRGATARY